MGYDSLFSMFKFDTKVRQFYKYHCMCVALGDNDGLIMGAPETI